MNTRHPLRCFWLTLAALVLAIAFVTEIAITQAPGSSQSNSNMSAANGLKVVTFSVNPGRIRVYLPDDMAAGDTISGTVETEPNGSTAEERMTNQELLDQFTLDLEGTKLPVKQPSFVWVPPVPRANAPVRYRLNVYDTSSYDYLLETDSGAKTIGGEWTGDSKTKHPDFIWAPLGQQGRPNAIYGPFDGRLSTTLIKVGGQEAKMLAESPRKSVFESPYAVVGPTQITLKEGNTDTQGNYRNVGVRLSAPKTNLQKGESTTLKVEVSGLEGIKEPVPLTLESRGVITMAGGMYQPLTIQASQVGADGGYATTREITGVQAGGWTATATVVTQPFNICLQDDTVPARVVLWNSFTGDYIFSCPGCPKTVTGQTSQSGAAGTGKVTIKGCTIVLEQDRRVRINFDNCAKAGRATVESSAPKVKFTITDRNTADNTCSVR